MASITLLALLWGSAALYGAPCANPYPAAKIIHDQRETITFATENGDFIICSLQNGRVIKKFKRPVGSIDSLAIDKSGNYLIAGGYSMHLQLFNLARGSHIRTIERDTWAPVNVLHGRNLFYLSMGNMIQVRTYKDGQLEEKLIGHEKDIRQLILSPDKKWLLSAAADKVRLWPFPDLKRPGRDYALIKSTAVAFHNEGQHFFAAVKRETDYQLSQVNVKTAHTRELVTMPRRIGMIYHDHPNEQLIFQSGRALHFLDLSAKKQKMISHSYREYGLGQVHFWPQRNLLVSFQLRTGLMQLWKLKKGDLAPWGAIRSGFK